MKTSNVVPLEERLLRPKDVAALCGCSVSLVRHAIRRGELKGRKFGPKVVVVTWPDAVAWRDAQLRDLDLREGGEV